MKRAGSRAAERILTLQAAGAGVSGFGAHVLAYYRRGRTGGESLPAFLERLAPHEFARLVAVATGAEPAALAG